MKSIFSFLVATLLVGHFAQADQCQWNSKAVADNARDIIVKLSDINNTKYPFVVKHCTHCDGMDSDAGYKYYLTKAQGESQQMSIMGSSNETGWLVKAAKIHSNYSDKPYYGLVLYNEAGHGWELDLAYSYVKVGPGKFASLAYMTDCDLMEEEPAFIYADEEFNSWDYVRDNRAMDKFWVRKKFTH